MPPHLSRACADSCVSLRFLPLRSFVAAFLRDNHCTTTRRPIPLQKLFFDMYSECSDGTLDSKHMNNGAQDCPPSVDNDKLDMTSAPF